MTSVARIGNVDHSLAERRERRRLRDHSDPPRTLMDVHREIAGLPFGSPRRTVLLAESARIVSERQADMPDGPAAA